MLYPVPQNVFHFEKEGTVPFLLVGISRSLDFNDCGEAGGRLAPALC